MLSAYFNNNKQQICINLTIRNIVWFKLSLSISQLTCFNSLVYSAEEKLTTFLDWFFIKVGQKFVLAYCSVRLVLKSFLILWYVQKDHFVAENIQRQLINFNILLGLSLSLICFTNDKKLFW